MDTRESSRLDGRTLIGHEGQAERLTGDEVMARIADVLRESLPLVRPDDRFYFTLHSLARACRVTVRPVRDVSGRPDNGEAN